MAEEMKQRGLSKLAPKAPAGKPPAAHEAHAPAAPREGMHDGGGEMKTHTLHEHPDGHLTSRMHDGTETEHPHHTHALAHMGHHMTGGDKHHMAHHDGMGITSHGIHEDGTHDGPHEHNSAEEAKEAFGNFMDEEAGEPSHQDGGSWEEESDHEPSYGGMGR